MSDFNPNCLDILTEIALGIYEDGHQADAVFCSPDVFLTLATDCGFPDKMRQEIMTKGPQEFTLNMPCGPVKIFTQRLLREPSMYVARRVDLGAGNEQLVEND